MLLKNSKSFSVVLIVSHENTTEFCYKLHTLGIVQSLTEEIEWVAEPAVRPPHQYDRTTFLCPD